MAKKSGANGSKNGLEQAMILLIQNQATFVSQINASNERFARIESELAEIKSILLRHEGILLKHEQKLDDLTEAIREKIGFKHRQ